MEAKKTETERAAERTLLRRKLDEWIGAHRNNAAARLRLGSDEVATLLEMLSKGAKPKTDPKPGKGPAVSSSTSRTDAQEDRPGPDRQ